MPILRLHREYGCALFLLWVVAALDPGEAADTQEARLAACEPKTCGKGPDVSFPFWIRGEHQPYCGLPAFKLNCEDGYPMLPISRDYYTVLNISYNRATMELTKRFPEITKNCSSFPNRNLTLERTPFTVPNTSNTSLFFFYHCNLTLLQPPREVPMTAGVEPLPCDQLDVAFRSFVGYSPLLPQPVLARLLGACSAVVNLPIAPFSLSLGDNITYRQLMDFRITLNWTATECAKCENTGGRCGANFTGENNNFNFICICEDRDHRVSCDGQGQQSKQSSKWTIIGSTVSGVGFVMGLLFLFICCLRRSVVRKRNAYLPSLTQLFKAAVGLSGKNLELLLTCTSSKTNLHESRAIEVFLEEYKSVELKRLMLMKTKLKIIVRSCKRVNVIEHHGL